MRTEESVGYFPNIRRAQLQAKTCLQQFPQGIGNCLASKGKLVSGASCFRDIVQPVLVVEELRQNPCKVGRVIGDKDVSARRKVCDPTDAHLGAEDGHAEGPRFDDSCAPAGGLGRRNHLKIISAVSGSDVFHEPGEMHIRIGPRHFDNHLSSRLVRFPLADDFKS